MSKFQKSGPNVIGATGGSGTRVVARIIRRCGVFLGSHLNESEDSLDLAEYLDRWINPFVGRERFPLSADAEVMMAEELDMVLRRHMAGLNGSVEPWGWKEPRSLYLLPFVHKQFPELKFLHLVRDGRDMAFSANQNQLREHGGALLNSEERAWSQPLQSIALWSRVNLLAAEYAETNMGAGYLRLRFEDLCANPAFAIGRICEFFALEGDAEEIGRLEVSPPESLGRWQARDGKIVAELERVGRAALKKFGYRMREPRGISSKMQSPSRPKTAAGNGIEPQVICVLGMHRSGTSLISGLLKLLGVYLGPEQHLMKPNDFNPKGFWEHRFLTDLNDEILARLGGSWDAPPPFAAGWASAPELADLRQRARALIREEFSGHRFWGWKDPRTCLTLPFWQRLAPAMQYVICLRNPVDVARSLERRDGFSFEKGVNLWLAHVKSAMEHAAGQRRIFFFYEDLIADWEQEISRLCRFLGTPELAQREEIRSAAQRFISEDLQHHYTSITDTADQPALAYPAKSLYMVLRLCVTLQQKEMDEERCPTGGLQQALDHFALYSAKASADAEALQGKAARWQKQAENQKQRLAYLDDQVKILTTERDRLKQEAAEARVTMQAQQDAVAQASKEVEQLRTDCLRWNQEAAELRSTARDQRDLLTVIQNSLAWTFVVKFRGIRDRGFPEGTERRRVYDLIKGLLKRRFQHEPRVPARAAQESSAPTRIGTLWRRKAYTSISLNGLTPISQTTAHPNPAEAIGWLPGVTIDAEAKPALFLHPVSSVAYRLFVPPRARFLSSVALMPDAWGRNQGGVLFQLEALRPDGELSLTYKTFVHPTRFRRHRKWIKFQTSLRRFANQEITLVLSTGVAAEATAEYAWSVWGEPKLLFLRPKELILTSIKNGFKTHGIFGGIKKVLGKSGNATAALPETHEAISYLQSRSAGESSPPEPARDRYFGQLFRQSGGESSEYVPLAAESLPLAETDVKLIAFYLPQFHPIPENDEWWGKGFTEWTQVSKALPQFTGHYQPRLPGELGFYDLRLVDVQRRQIELAKKYGIYGFCFHYYWFDGKRLLELPLVQFLQQPDLDMPFCLCWANESWTRRWDGLEDEILLSQCHSPADDLAFIQSLEPVFRDPRYIKIHGHPLLIIYRPSLMPDPKATARRWRDYCRETGIGDIFLVAAQAFDTTDPRPLGFDAAVEFPPHKIARGATVLNSRLEIVNPQYQGLVFDYAYLVESAKKVTEADFTLFRGVCPSWDNEPRRPGRGQTYANSTPALYEEWLTDACAFAMRNPDPDKKVVFINAWNEWGEGAYLEPDRRFGYSYLQATANALTKMTELRQANRLEIVFVSHDACRAGAQRLLIALIQWLKHEKGIRPKIILRQGGVLAGEFRRLGPVLDMSSLEKRDPAEVNAELLRFCGNSPALVYINTVVPGDVADAVCALGIPIITHVHEMENGIRRWCDPDQLKRLLELTDHFIAAASPVAQNLIQVHGIAPSRVTTICEFIKCAPVPEGQPDKAAIRKAKQLPENAFIVFGCGTTDWRKGPDLFIEVAEHTKEMGLDNWRFYWIGGQTAAGEQEELDRRVSALGLEGLVTFLGEQSDPRAYFDGGDVFLMTSREDPFPLVCLEAADSGLPIVCFDDAGGIPEFVRDDAGYVVPFGDAKQMAERLFALYRDPRERKRLGDGASAKVRRNHDVSVGGEKIRHIITELARCRSGGPFDRDGQLASTGLLRAAPKVSVVVPNYNHAAYLRQRLDSVLSQDFQDFELIVLDDASTDGSREIIETYAGNQKVRCFPGNTNSGSVFRQWRKGLEVSRGEYIWFAESDDFASPCFLSRLVDILDGYPGVGLVYSQSFLVDRDSRILGDAGCWTDDLDSERWREDFFADGRKEVRNYLSKKNTIPNASAVLLRRSALNAVGGPEETYRLCGDWFLWVKVLLHSDMAYVAEKLNYWRQDSSNARVLPSGVSEWKEGEEILKYIGKEISLSEAETNRMLLDFLKRCFDWLEASQHGGIERAGAKYRQ
jgi:glycosyltransferase involved in cell wall biosynthesis